MIINSIFSVVAILLLCAASGVVLSKNPVHAALSLVLCFFLSAVIWLALGAEFLSIVLVLVYVGAVMVLFLFVVMMLNINQAMRPKNAPYYFAIGLGIMTTIALFMGITVSSDYFSTNLSQAQSTLLETPSNTSLIGRTLYTEYVYQFEIAGIILLIAIIAAIILTLGPKSSSKTIKTAEEQITANKKSRLRIIKMETEPTTETSTTKNSERT